MAPNNDRGMTLIGGKSTICLDFSVQLYRVPAAMADKKDRYTKYVVLTLKYDTWMTRPDLTGPATMMLDIMWLLLYIN